MPLLRCIITLDQGINDGFIFLDQIWNRRRVSKKKDQNLDIKAQHLPTGAGLFAW